MGRGGAGTRSGEVKIGAKTGVVPPDLVPLQIVRAERDLCPKPNLAIDPRLRPAYNVPLPFPKEKSDEACAADRRDVWAYLGTLAPACDGDRTAGLCRVISFRSFHL